MKKIDNNRQALIWGIVMLAVLGFTVGIFLDFAPYAPRYSYWIAMADVSLMEIITGTYFMYTLFISTKRAASKLPVAMHIGMQSTIIIFFAVSVAIAILFLLVFNSSAFDRVFMWVVIGKWVLLFVVIFLLQFAGREGEKEKETLASSRAERVGILSAVERALSELQRLSTSSEEGTLKQQVVDELGTLRNQLRSRISARPAVDDESCHLNNLLDELGSVVGSLNSAPASERNGILLRVRESVRKMSQEIAYPSVTKKV